MAHAYSKRTAYISGDTLTLIGGKGTIGVTFELNRSK